MKKIVLVLALAGLFIMPVQAQTAETEAGETTAPPGATVITSDELHMDQAAHQSVFSGNVIVVGSNFKMTCQEMTVFFTTGNKIDSILAKGDVVILQPGRITHCGQAHYFRDEDKFDLTDQPSILENKNKLEAPEIIIYRAKKEVDSKGRSRTTVMQNLGSGSTNATDAAPLPQ